MFFLLLPQSLGWWHSSALSIQIRVWLLRLTVSLKNVPVCRHHSEQPLRTRERVYLTLLTVQVTERCLETLIYISGEAGAKREQRNISFWVTKTIIPVDGGVIGDLHASLKSLFFWRTTLWKQRMFPFETKLAIIEDWKKDLEGTVDSRFTLDVLTLAYQKAIITTN